MRNKQVEFQSLYLYFNYFIKIVPFWLRDIRFFNTKHPVIILRVSLFAVTPSHVASSKIECQNCSYVYRSRKHLECKYFKKYSAWIANNRYFPTCVYELYKLYINHQEVGIISTYISLSIFFQLGTSFTYYPCSNPVCSCHLKQN